MEINIRFSYGIEYVEESESDCDYIITFTDSELEVFERLQWSISIRGFIRIFYCWYFDCFADHKNDMEEFLTEIIEVTDTTLKWREYDDAYEGILTWKR